MLPRKHHLNNNHWDTDRPQSFGFPSMVPPGPSGSSSRASWRGGGGGSRGGGGGSSRGSFPSRGGRPVQPSNGSENSPPKRRKPNKPLPPPLPQLALPLNSKSHMLSVFTLQVSQFNPAMAVPRPQWVENPKGVISNYMAALHLGAPKYTAVEGVIDAPALASGNKIWRVTVQVDPEDGIAGIGDDPVRKDAEKLAALSACLNLGANDMFDKSNRPSKLSSSSRRQNASGDVAMANAQSSNANAGTAPVQQAGKNSVALTTGEAVGLERARQFLDYYCTRYRFGKPDLRYVAGAKSRKSNPIWSATLVVAGSRIGLGQGKNKKDAANQAYLDATRYLQSCDDDLWAQFQRAAGSGSAAGKQQVPHIVFHASDSLDDDLADLVHEARESELYKRAQHMLSKEERERRKSQAKALRSAEQGPDGVDTVQAASSSSGAVQLPPNVPRGPGGHQSTSRRSEDLISRLNDYQTNARVSSLREQRQTLPVTAHAGAVLAKVSVNPVTVLMAATGSGKTTQIPSLILDDWILKGDGGKCNIICTQPRRIAAISVAERVAKERGEELGETVGYQVRFESKPPRASGGTVLFCTTGVFLRRLQNDLESEENPLNSGRSEFLDKITHIVVDEVHERDVDTDLLLYVLRKLLNERRKRGKSEVKVVLMSATIDPHLFTDYFAEKRTDGRVVPAPVVEVPGRSFPVEKHWLDEVVTNLHNLRLAPAQGGWIWSERNVQDYLDRELQQGLAARHSSGGLVGEDALEMPYPLISLMIARVITTSEEGHVLVFLPGWDEIQGVRNILTDRNRFPLLGLNFSDVSKFEIHLLHSTIPVAEQQAVFSPPPSGVRRIILSTNIAETSVTIPDVVYVIDSAKCKENRFDPERHLSSLVSAWVGTSNLNQRAGRAGRHRPGEYYSLVSEERLTTLDVHSTVEMKRVDLSNVVMHCKALFPGMLVEEVLAGTIEAPEEARVAAAIHSLRITGALDSDNNITSLGRVLLQLPVEVAIGKLCLLGSFFRCLDQTLTLAAVLTNRDPFLSPPLLKQEASVIKNSWSPPEFRSDILATLRAYNTWWEMQGSGRYVEGNKFAHDNFLSKPTMLMIAKVKEHLLQSLDKAGVLRISGGGQTYDGPRGRRSNPIIPSSLNVNGESLPLLAALIAVAVAPNFAVRISKGAFRTSQDKSCLIHPSSVNHPKREKESGEDNKVVTGDRQILAFREKIQNISQAKPGGKTGDPAMFLRETTRLDPLGYMLFGTNELAVSERGLEGDGWLPIFGNVGALDDVERLKEVLDLSLLRVFEGLQVEMSKKHQPRGGRGFRAAASGPSGEAEDNEMEVDLEDDAAAYLEDPSLSAAELGDLEKLTLGVVRVLNGYAEERLQSASRMPSRPDTPQSGLATPAGLRLSSGLGEDGRPDSRGSSRSQTPLSRGFGASRNTSLTSFSSSKFRS